MIVGISGSREYPEPQEVLNFLYQLGAQSPDAMIISGGRGIVDKTAEKYAHNVLGMDVISFRPVEIRPDHFEIVTLAYGDRAAAYVDEHGLREITAHHTTFGSAAFARNIYIVQESERIIAFWDGKSPGTQNTIKAAKLKPIPVSIKRPGLPMQLAA